MICAGNSNFEFDGEITEMTDDHLVLKAKHGDIFIERKYLVFIQFLEDELEKPVPEVEAPQVKQKDPRIDAAVKFVNKRFKKDPLEEKLTAKLIPPSQYPDEFEEYIPPDIDEDDLEVIRKVNGMPTPPPKDFKAAIKAAMSNEDFSMDGSAEYANTLKTVLGIKNAGYKKTTRD